MATINLDIIFPQRLANGTSPPPIVIQPHVVAKQFDRINWTLYAVNDAIEEVEIEFSNYDFFGPGKPNFRKPLRGKGKETIYANVPDLDEQRPVGAKYTVRGFNAEGCSISEVDPVIIVDEP